mgnify:FL=1
MSIPQSCGSPRHAPSSLVFRPLGTHEHRCPDCKIHYQFDVTETELDKLFRHAQERGDMPWIRPECLPANVSGLLEWEIDDLMRSRDVHNTMQRFLSYSVRAT